MDNKKAIKHIDDAFRLISGLTVSGENVDVVFMAKQELREAYKMLSEEEKSDG